jgi:hypothetical protein
MTIYMTKVWGFGIPCGPLQFRTSGWRDAARDILKAGDLVAVVGTKGEQTDRDAQGRVLGMIEPTTEVVSSLDFDLETVLKKPRRSCRISSKRRATSAASFTF